MIWRGPRFRRALRLMIAESGTDDAVFLGKLDLWVYSPSCPGRLGERGALGVSKQTAGLGPSPPGDSRFHPAGRSASPGRGPYHFPGRPLDGPFLAQPSPGEPAPGLPAFSRRGEREGNSSRVIEPGRGHAPLASPVLLRYLAGISFPLATIVSQVAPFPSPAGTFRKSCFCLSR